MARKSEHDALHMAPWTVSGHCYCMCSMCFMWSNDPADGGICICHNCPCGGSKIVTLRVFAERGIVNV